MHWRHNPKITEADMQMPSAVFALLPDTVLDEVEEFMERQKERKEEVSCSMCVFQLQVLLSNYSVRVPKAREADV